MTVPDGLLKAVRNYPDRIALRDFSTGATTTWSQLWDSVESLAAGLVGSGVQRGVTVATMLRNRPEFFAVDLAVVSVGATPVAIYNTSPPAGIAHILSDAGAVLVITEQDFVGVVQDAVDLVSYPIEVVVIDHTGGMSFARFLARGDIEFSLEAAITDVRPADIALLCYTSGTTGAPKGVQLSHDNLLAAYEAILDLDPLASENPRVVSYLPAAHIGDRLYGYYVAVLGGGEITTVADFGQVLDAVAATSPTVFIGVPRVWEKLRSRLLDAGEDLSDAAARARLRRDAGLNPEALLLSGSAPIDPDVLGFFDRLGVPILEGYGMTEASCIISGNRRDDRRPGTVGRAAGGVEIRIEAGEILVRGRVVTAGYRNLPEETAAAIDKDGWLHTGDIGRIDADGFITILGRQKELIMNSSGLSVAPTVFEQALRAASPLVANVAMIGDRRPYFVGLVAIDRGAAQEFTGDAEEAVHSSAVEKAVGEAVDDVNRRFARAEQVRRFAVVSDDWTVESGLLTPSLKLRRDAISTRFHTDIERLYTNS